MCKGGVALHQVVSEHTFIRVSECICISGIRAGVPEHVDRSPKLRQFTPRPILFITCKISCDLANMTIICINLYFHIVV